MIRILRDRQTSWYRFVRQIHVRSGFRIEACECVILFSSTIIYRVVQLLFTFKQRLFSNASLTYEQWKLVKKNYGCTLCTSDINIFISSLSCFIVTFKWRLNFTAITYMYLALTSKASFKRTINRRPKVQIFAFKAQALFT